MVSSSVPLFKSLVSVPLFKSLVSVPLFKSLIRLYREEIPDLPSDGGCFTTRSPRQSVLVTDWDE